MADDGFRFEPMKLSINDLMELMGGSKGYVTLDEEESDAHAFPAEFPPGWVEPYVRPLDESKRYIIDMDNGDAVAWGAKLHPRQPVALTATGSNTRWLTEAKTLQPDYASTLRYSHTDQGHAITIDWPQLAFVPPTPPKLGALVRTAARDALRLGRLTLAARLLRHEPITESATGCDCCNDY